MTLHVRTTGDPLAMLPSVRQALHDLDPHIALVRPRRRVLALGATHASIFAVLIKRGVWLIGLGLVLGLGAATAGGGVVRSLLFGVEPTDPVTWLTVSGLLLLVGLAACAIPARRAMRVEPVVALRTP